ncbi:hypothetical protein KIV56_17300 [Cryobacterium breve]|uniref:Helicase C-terminal domain-containing protein n=1 Tax=Cryobacterium breve TaxID=1259258 RepID=A0ABY7NC87_9MICO|nr:helicase-related protein [Cryobacterium breve]WBM79899.1 hypothetical protein KIV56_17300 [Cryobacterium breve]
MKASVNALASEVVKLHLQGALPSVFDGDPHQLDTALAIGSEWFGLNHPILDCLRIGVAVHHGSLPGPYRKEIERLLQLGALKITISSPTLAQGLNLSASALVIHSLWRSGKMIEPSEFRNIVGRAGRAFIDSSGLIVHPMFEPTWRARKNWSDLVADAQPRDMQSGLVRLLLELLVRMQRSLGETDLDRLLEYVTSAAAWSFPELADEAAADASISRRTWTSQVASLDSALLSLVHDVEIEQSDVAASLDAALSSSLWARTLAHKNESVRLALRVGLLARSEVIWRGSTPAQRKGYYLAGVGFQTGRQLDLYSDELNRHLRAADASIMLGHETQAVESIIEFARIAFNVVPFTPKALPNNWEEVLADWLRGRQVVEIRSDDGFAVFEFIEESLAYRLPWALESVRVRATAHESADSSPWDLDTPDLGLAVAAVESGTLNRSTSLLMRAGFASRSGAIAAVDSTGATFTTLTEMNAWLNSEIVLERASDLGWPTLSTREVWASFRARSTPSQQRTWHHEEHEVAAAWYGSYQPTPGAPYRAVSLDHDETVLETSDAQRVGKLVSALNPRRQGLLRVTARNVPNAVELSYLGPADLTF